MSAPTQRVLRPGFGLPLNYLPKWHDPRDDRPDEELESDSSESDMSDQTVRDRFPHPIADRYASRGVTRRERRMLNFINQISDKPGWERKVFEESIVEKWRTEACKFDENLEDYYLSAEMFDFVSFSTEWEMDADTNRCQVHR
jgi:hypothetical protein